MKRIFFFVLCLLCLLSGAFAIQNDSSLLAHWKLENLTDSSGNGNTLTDSTGATYTANGYYDGAYEFFGSSDYLSDGKITNTFPNGFTVAGWTKINTAMSNWGALWSQGQRDDANDWVALRIYGDGAGTCEAGIVTSDAGSNYFGTSVTTACDEWIFVVATYDNTNMKLYINNSLVDTTAGSGSALTSFDDESWVGKYDNSGTSSFDFMNGKIDDVSVWDRVLNTTELTDLYQNGITYGGGPTPTIQHNTQDFYNSENITIQLNTTSDVNMSYILDNGTLTNICYNCNNSILNLNDLSEGAHSILFVSEDENGQANSTATFTIDTQPANVSVNIFTEWNNGYIVTDLNTTLNITCEDTNLDMCEIHWDDNTTTNILTTQTKTFTTNGNHSFVLHSHDLSNNTAEANGTIFINPYQYFYFKDIETTDNIYNYTFNNEFFEYEAKFKIFDIGLGEKSFYFLKAGYQETYFNLNFNETSDYNITYNVSRARLIFYIYDQITKELINETITLTLIGESNIQLNTTTGVFNISTYLIPGTYQAFVTSENYLSNQKTFYFNSTSILTNNLYMLPYDSDLTGYIIVVTYNNDNTFATGITVTANEWDSESNSYIETYQTQSDTNGQAIIPVVLQNEIYKFCAEYDTGTSCFPDGELGQVISSVQNGETFPILPSLSFPSFQSISEDLIYTRNNFSLSNYSNDYYNYTVDYSWKNIYNVNSEVCTKLEKNYNYSKETVLDTCSISSSGSYYNEFLLNKSYSYILTVYEKDGLQEIVLDLGFVNGNDNFWNLLEDYNLLIIFKILLVILMVAIIPFLPNPILVFSDVILIMVFTWRYIAPQDLSIISVGVYIIMGIVTLWSVSKR